MKHLWKLWSRDKFAKVFAALFIKTSFWDKSVSKKSIIDLKFYSWNFDIKVYVQDKFDNDTITFSVISLSEWSIKLIKD